jgi:two-component system NtrC family sensor kinase
MDLLESRGPIERVGALDLAGLAEEILEGRRPSAGGEVKLHDALLDVTLSAMAGTGGRPEGLVLVLADVTQARRLQGQLAQAEKLSSLGQMISGIAHELNNPLASVLGYAQLVHASVADERLAKRLEVIHREARRCQKIVGNLLSFARRHEPEMKLLSLNEVAESVIGLMAYQLRVDGFSVRVELDRGLPPLLGDAHQLQQALLNLVTNSQHALRSGTPRGGELSIRTSSERPGWILLEVQDDGPGVPEEIRSRIFDPFFTTKTAGQGTGLGLSIVYGIVTAHGGSIRLEDRAGGGALFRVELPLGGAESAARSEVATVAPVRETAHGRILVVDDEEPVARLICEALAEDGHAAVAVHGGAEALDRLVGAEFDLVISDVRMPGMTIESMRREMENLRPGMSRRLLLTTGDTVSREADSLAEKEGLPLIHKPFDLDDLRGTVRSWLQACRGRESCDI